MIVGSDLATNSGAFSEATGRRIAMKFKHDGEGLFVNRIPDFQFNRISSYGAIEGDVHGRSRAFSAKWTHNNQWERMCPCMVIIQSSAYHY